MQKHEYIEHHRLSNVTPHDPSGKILPVRAFTESIEEFLNEHFKGSLKVTNKAHKEEFISLSPEYAALFFKTLLCYIYGRVFLNITISAEPQGIILDIEANDDLPLTDIEKRQLIKIARNAKIDIMITKSAINLSLKYAQSKRYRVYAISDGKHRMLAKLGEIFFGGEPIMKSDDTGS